MFLSWFPSIFQKGLYRGVSDHNPIMLGESGDDWGPKPFHIRNEWLESKELMNGVRDTWNKIKKGGYFSINWVRKSKTVKKFIRVWARERRVSGEVSKMLDN